MQQGYSLHKTFYIEAHRIASGSYDLEKENVPPQMKLILNEFDEMFKRIADKLAVNAIVAFTSTFDVALVVKVTYVSDFAFSYTVPREAKKLYPYAITGDHIVACNLGTGKWVHFNESDSAPEDSPDKKVSYTTTEIVKYIETILTLPEWLGTAFTYARAIGSKFDDRVTFLLNPRMEITSFWKPYFKDLKIGVLCRRTFSLTNINPSISVRISVRDKSLLPFFDSPALTRRKEHERLATLDFKMTEEETFDLIVKLHNINQSKREEPK
jgi:hypothetical protein